MRDPALNGRRIAGAAAWMVVIVTIIALAYFVNRNEAPGSVESEVDRSESEMRPHHPAPDDLAVASPDDARRRGTRAVRTTTILPPPDPATAPAIDQVRYWRQRMLAGDPDAACHVVQATRECAWQRSSYLPWARKRNERVMAGLADPHYADCREIVESDANGMFDTLLRSAQRGHQASALLFAMGGGFSTYWPFASPNELRRFKANAAPLAWKAFESGNTDAAVILWRSYNAVGVDSLPIAAAIDPDPVKAHALDLLMDDLVPDFIVGTAAEAGLSKEQAAQAEALHAEWRATSFAHARPPRFGMEIERMFDPEKRAVDLCAPDPR